MQKLSAELEEAEEKAEKIGILVSLSAYTLVLFLSQSSTTAAVKSGQQKNRKVSFCRPSKLPINKITTILTRRRL